MREAGLDRVRLDATIYDALAQRLDTTQVRITEAGIRFVHAKLRFALPARARPDGAARGAGRSKSRWSSFERAPFTGDSAFAVSVYRRA